jgi:hypothetical protein
MINLHKHLDVLENGNSNFAIFSGAMPGSNTQDCFENFQKEKAILNNLSSKFPFAYELRQNI